MKTPFHTHKLLKPLAGSICGLLILGGAVAPIIPGPASRADDMRAWLAKARRPAQPAEPKTAEEPARSPEDTLNAGLKYLLDQQHKDGGWGQGGGWRQAKSARASGGRVEGPNVEDPSDLGNTCVSLVTLLRAGQTLEQGEHHEAAARAFDYLCQQVEKADANSLYSTDVRDTQLQVKIGTYVDTFLAGWALSELKDKVGGEAAEARRVAALNKVVAKIEANQKDDGSFANNNGWAAVLSQGLCSKALNLASRSGAKVSQRALDRDQKQNTTGLDVSKGEFAPAAPAAEPSSAGVSLYREAAKWGGMREKVKSNAERKAVDEKTIADAEAAPAAKAQAQQEIDEFAKDDKAAEAANRAIAGRLSDARYTSGFGNNGGEEFLSYMNVTEGMKERGGKEWENWRAQMTKTVCGAQNQDGSWAGQHCITGRTFCTATALLTLLVDQQKSDSRISNANAAPAPIATK